jgi:signal transduction histidine kinase/ActR/RegA family two-component response regulator
MGQTEAAQLAGAPLALSVALAAWYGGVGPGLFALIQAALVIDYLFIGPGAFFGPVTVGQFLAFTAFVAGAVAFCIAAERRFRQSRTDRELRLAAERRSFQATRLSQLARALAQARTPRWVIEAAVQEPLHGLNGDAGVLFLVSSGELAEPARAVGYASTAYQAPIALDPAQPSNPLADAVARASIVVLESPEALAIEYPGAGADPSGEVFQTTAVVPLLIGSRVAAALRLDFRTARVFGADDREYLAAIGTHAAQALDRAWRLEHAEQARSEAESLQAKADQELVERKAIERALRSSETRYRALAARTSRLHALSAALSEAVTTEAVARAVIAHGRTVVGATAGEVILLVETGTQFEVIYDAAMPSHSEEHFRFPVEPGWCSTQVVQTGQPVFVKSFAEWQERFSRSAAAAADGGFESSATMPLQVEGATIGVLAFHFTVPVNFDDDYQALLMSVAGHCAQALDRARLYESTQRARADAEKANRIKDEFVSIVSHELRTPLNAILGWATMLQRGGLDRDKSARALQSVCDNASRQARLIDDLLDFSRVSAGRVALQMESVDIRALIRGVVESMSPTAVVRGIDLTLSSLPPVEVRGDIRRLEQVFFNLIENALKFTPKGGRVTVDVRIVDGRVDVRVQDSGVGIDPEFLPLVFDRFRQADSTTTRTYGGLGLGLSIARQLVEAHKGRISAESAGKGQGAAFTVSLPIAAHLAEAATDPHSLIAAAPAAPDVPLETRLDGLRVLVVDDEPDAREIMAHTLQKCGASVAVAANAQDALDILDQGRVDVLLSDIAMPGEDGFSLIRRVRMSSAPEVAAIPAAAVTSFTREEQRKTALAAGYQLHLPKPLGPEDLIKAVHQLARRAIH